MGDSDSAESVPLPLKEIPIPSPTTPATSSSMTAVAQAEQFLRDPEVRDQCREKKIEFLKTKGLEEAEILALLDHKTDAESRDQHSYPEKRS